MTKAVRASLRRSGPRVGRRALLALLSTLLVLYVLGPVYWVFASSVMSEADVVARPTQWVPERPTLANFRGIFFYDDERVTYETRRAADPATGEFIPSSAQHLLPSLLNSLYVGLWVGRRCSGPGRSNRARPNLDSSTERPARCCRR